MKTIKSLLLSISLLSFATLYAQGDFEGVMTMDTYNGEIDETAAVTWYIKGDMHKMRFNSSVKDTAYGYTLIMRDGNTKMLTDLENGKFVYDIPANAKAQNNMAGAKLTATDNTKEIAGYACTEYVAEFGDKTIEAWIAEDFPVSFASLSPLMKAEGVLNVMKRSGIKGLPLAYTLTDGAGNVISSQTVTAVTPKMLASSEFDVPPGYKEFSGQ